MNWSRRDFLKHSLAGIVASSVPWRAFSQSEQEPHFFIHLFYMNGWEPTYLFDARPLEMTKNNLIHNYLGVEPGVWVGLNGKETLVHEPVSVLRPLASDLTIIRGVLMSPSFDGHEQNINFAMTGNPFGGESFIPHLNHGLEKGILDFVQSGFLLVDVTNNQLGIELNYSTARELAGVVGKMSVDPSDPLSKFVSSRMAYQSSGGGLFSVGKRQLEKGHGSSFDLGRRLGQIQLPREEQLTPVGEAVRLATQFFQGGITRSSLISRNDFAALPLDSHDPATAKRQPQNCKTIANEIHELITYLKTTPFDSKRSFLDVTTVFISSEFGRTMRQIAPIDATGTDHNQLSNMVILAGKGIQKGWIVGSSDRLSSSAPVSEAHVSMDRALSRVMAMPFDSKNLEVSTALPTLFREEDYLSYSSVVNTVLYRFGVPKEHWRKFPRTETAYPILHKLLI